MDIVRAHVVVVEGTIVAVAMSTWLLVLEDAFCCEAAAAVVLAFGLLSAIPH